MTFKSYGLSSVVCFYWSCDRKVSSSASATSESRCSFCTETQQHASPLIKLCLQMSRCPPQVVWYFSQRALWVREGLTSVKLIHKSQITRFFPDTEMTFSSVVFRYRGQRNRKHREQVYFPVFSLASFLLLCLNLRQHVRSHMRP